MNKTTRYLAFVVALGFFCFAAQAQKSTNHSFSNVTAHAYYYEWAWDVVDFALSMTNPNAQQISVQTTLIADNPNYEYEPNCVNPVGGRCIGTYEFPPHILTRYYPSDRNTCFVQSGENMMGYAFPAATEGDAFSWAGTVEVESSQAFYVVGPDCLQASGRGNSQLDAFEEAWGEYESSIPVFWDGDLSKAVVPYAILYQNTSDWPEGWETKVSIQNNSGQSASYTIENYLSFGGHQHSNQSNCDMTLDERSIFTTVQVSDGQLVQNIEPYRNGESGVCLGMPSNKFARHEGALFIGMSPLASGTTFSVYVSPNSSGQALCY